MYLVWLVGTRKKNTISIPKCKWFHFGIICIRMLEFTFKFRRKKKSSEKLTKNELNPGHIHTLNILEQNTQHASPMFFIETIYAAGHFNYMLYMLHTSFVLQTLMFWFNFFFCILIWVFRVWSRFYLLAQNIELDCNDFGCIWSWYLVIDLSIHFVE